MTERCRDGYRDEGYDALGEVGWQIVGCFYCLCVDFCGANATSCQWCS